MLFRQTRHRHHLGQPKLGQYLHGDAERSLAAIHDAQQIGQQLPGFIRFARLAARIGRRLLDRGGGSGA